jgi:hypothetical protein
LPIHSLPYREFVSPASASFPTGRTARRPILQLALLNGTSRLSCYAIVDSGADDCLFPRSFMQPLGLDPLTIPIEQTRGVGSTSIPTQYAKLAIHIPGIVEFAVYAGFTSGMDPMGFGLLGQTGFFERFKVAFDYSSRVYTIEVP